MYSKMKKTTTVGSAKQWGKSLPRSKIASCPLIHVGGLGRSVHTYGLPNPVLASSSSPFSLDAHPEVMNINGAADGTPS